jgi:4-amino-4-deoxy-L-arabinose transferase-like glycosyltransferase
MPGSRSLTAALGVALAIFAYAYGLSSISAPTIGDETLYLQIARKTAESGKLLPLLSETGITDTKPPLLFWQGILVSGFGRSWELWRLRAPVVALTFVTALLVGILAARCSGRRSIGLLAALVFLGFRSTIQYGRPFLTNAGEALFLFVPFVLIHRRTTTGARLAVACGLSFGVAALYKSFAVVAPGTFALLLVLWRRERWDAAALLRRHGAFVASTVTIALAVFGLWLALDPRPDLVIAQFVVGENAGKFRPAMFLSGLFAGPYPLWRIWLGDLANAGLYAPLVAALLLDLWRRRRALPDTEAELWLFVLAFLAFYSVPTQRQENYLLATCAALAVLLALRWEALPGWAFRVILGALAFAGLLLPWFESALAAHVGTSLFSPLALLVPLVIGLVALVGAVRLPLGRAALPHLALSVVVAASLFLDPFSAAFPETATAEVRGKPVLFPDRFGRYHEQGRFLLPGADLQSYSCPPGPGACPPPPAYVGLHAALELDTQERVPPGWEEIASLPHLKSRHTPAQIAEIAAGRLELLVGRLVLVRPAAVVRR